MPLLIDDRNREVNVPEKAERIISLSPSVTEILFELGLGENVVGVTPFCVRPPDARKKRKVASYGYASVEQFRKLKPDLILTVTGYQNQVADQLSGNFNLFSFRLPSSLSGVLDLVTKVGIVTGEEEKGRLLEMELWDRTKDIKRGKLSSVYFECDLGGPVSFGSLSYITDVLRFMNFKSIYSAEYREWLTPDFEYVKREDPDYLIFEPKMFARREEKMIQKMLSSRGWEALSACRNNRVYVTPGNFDFLAHHGPSLIREVLPWLERIGMEAERKQ